MRRMILCLFALPAAADPAVVDSVDAQASGGAWRFDVTLSHADTGWQDYADGWRVVDADGHVLGTRELLHPHVNEQPFTRSLTGVEIPEGTERVWIETSTRPEGWDDGRFEVELP
ncbi:hypothetical protein [Vannielia litorea]|uniref:Uncharacterized protein n=1 Tax=Vannielia litorea TaxID=1217970 RepID=A0A1N6GRK7_9RHOB|nr:hypothetical protein [Vannielia litorea]SIO10164.1 hypothetical protein SAMN05444002_2717 [Vannielia litorea]